MLLRLVAVEAQNCYGLNDFNVLFVNRALKKEFVLLSMLLVSFYNLRKTFELNVIPATSRCEKSLVSILIWTGSENHVKNHLDGAYMESGYGSFRYS